jgi:hypothetical protein
MAGIAASQHNLPTARCRRDRASVDMQIRSSCLKKSSFHELLRNIEQRHLSNSGSDISHLSETGARRHTLRKCADAQLSLVRFLI